MLCRLSAYLILERLTFTFDFLSLLALLSSTRIERTLKFLVLGSETDDFLLVVADQFFPLPFEFFLFGGQSGTLLRGLGRAANELLLQALVLIVGLLVFGVGFSLLTH